MLVLTRKLKEQIRIGDNITITILRIKGKSVRIGIDAPDYVRILRSELPGQYGQVIKEIFMNFENKIFAKKHLKNAGEKNISS